MGFPHEKNRAFRCQFSLSLKPIHWLTGNRPNIPFLREVAVMLLHTSPRPIYQFQLLMNLFMSPNHYRIHTLMYIVWSHHIWSNIMVYHIDSTGSRYLCVLQCMNPFRVYKNPDWKNALTNMFPSFISQTSFTSYIPIVFMVKTISQHL